MAQQAPSPETILLLDDDQHFRQLVSKLLTMAGFKVAEAQTAMVATAMITERRPVLAIVDYRLPGMNGITWIEHMRQAGITIPIIVSTAMKLDGENLDEVLRRLNVQVVVQKPIDPADLLRQVERLVCPAKPTAESSSNPPSSVTAAVAISAPKQKAEPKISGLWPGDPGAPPSVDEFLAELEKELEDARVVYLRDTARELGQFLGKHRTLDTLDREVVIEIRYISHKIRGTSGSYKLMEVSRIAASIEDMVLAERKPDETEYLNSVLSTLLHDLRRTVEDELKQRDPTGALRDQHPDR